MCGCRMPKQYFIAVVCDSKLHAIILWHVISMKLNIGKKITELQIMMLNHKKISKLICKVSKLIELSYIHCLQGCFRKKTCREDV